MDLVIVESPSKIKKIKSILGDKYMVSSSVGHITEISGDIDLNNNFKTTYKVSKDKAKVVSNLRGLSKKADTVYLAMDDDREGEAIAWHLMEVLKLPKNSPRAKFHEITKKEILSIIPNKVEPLDMDMVNAQQARRVLDRIVGFQISPILWNKIENAKSAGRVQSPTTRIIVDRENLIRSHKPDSKYLVYAGCTKDGIDFKANLENSFNKDDAISMLKKYTNPKINLTVADVQKKDGKRSPKQPFITSTFQQAASSILKLSPTKSMQAAQSLFAEGLITYMRTDSPALAQEAIDEAKEIICKEFGDNYHQPRQFKSKDSQSQEAHEAIRPTHLSTTNVSLGDIQQKVYTLIRNRTLESQMADAKSDKTIIHFKDNYDNNYIANGSTLTFDGFLRLTGSKTEDNLLPALAVNESITPIKVIAKQTWSKPKGRYDDAKLIKKLESLGIGRPSTFATMVETVKARGYVVIGDVDGDVVNSTIMTLIVATADITSSEKSEKIGNDTKKLLPTKSAYELIDFMHEYFPNIIDYGFTADLELKLDEIASSKISWTDMLHEFYNVFKENVSAAKAMSNHSNFQEKVSLGVCPKTNAAITLEDGKYGKYLKLHIDKPKYGNIPKHIDIDTMDLDLALKLLDMPREVAVFNGSKIIAAYGPNGGYIKCDNAYINLEDGGPENITEAQAIEFFQRREAELADMPKCEACGKPLQIKDGKFGKWYACTGFPKCKHKQSQKP